MNSNMQFSWAAGGGGGSGGGSAVVIDVSASLVYNDPTKAAANAAVIQAALNKVATLGVVSVQVTLPGVYYANQIVMPSNSAFTVGAGVTHRKPASYNLCMFINQGALQGTPVGDVNIGFFGDGTIDGNSANQAGLVQAVSVITPGTFLYGIQGDIAMINVTGLEVAVQNPYNTNGFFVQFIGSNAYFHDMNLNVTRDFLHINGPSKNIDIDRCQGYSNDAFVGLNAWDWHRSSPSVGDITDVRIKSCAYYGAYGLAGQTRSSSMVVFLPGTRTTGAGTGTGNVKNVTVDGFDVTMSSQAAAPASPAFSFTADFDQVQGSEYSGTGTVENVKIMNGYCSIPNANCNLLVVQKTASGAPADGQNTLTVKNLTVEQVHADCSTGTNGNIPVSIQIPYNTINIDGITFRDCEWTPSGLSSNQAFIQIGNKTVLNKIEVDGLIINASAATGATAAAFINTYTSGVASVVDDLTLDRIMTATGVTLPQSWFLLAGVVNNFRSRGCRIYGTPAGNDGQGIVLAAATASIGYGVVSDGYFSGVKEGLHVQAGAAAGVNLLWQNCKIVNQTHPTFTQAAIPVKVTYDDCLLDTGANIARVDGNATFTIALSNTTVTGAGATALTVVTGTVRMIKNELAQITAAGTVLTPQNNDLVNFAGTPAYSGAVVQGGGTGAGVYIYRGTGTTGWVKLN